jgi:hypothetical protein
MAAASSRDSTAMKTPAFLTTLFLPGTFIATVFSTGMFNWQGDSKNSGDGRVVSRLFWVYWAFAVPLIIAVAVGWRLWWSWEKRHFDEDVNAEIEAIDGDGEPIDSGVYEMLADGYRYPPSIALASQIDLGARSRTRNYLTDMKIAIKRQTKMMEARQSQYMAQRV